MKKKHKNANKKWNILAFNKCFVLTTKVINKPN